MLETRLRELHQDKLANLLENRATFADRKLIEADLDITNTTAVKRILNSEGLYSPPKGAIEPVEIIPAAFASTKDAEKYFSIGEGLLRKGKVAVVLVAGGQGSRLGISVPKGTVEVSPVRHKSLFQIHCEKILALKKRYGSAIHFFIMTSRANDKDIKDYFLINNNFGLSNEEVHFFMQGMLPSFTIQSEFILSRNGSLFMNPDGHGGTFAALKFSGSLKKMQSMGIEEIFYFQVDNPLVNVCDPLFIGLHCSKRAQMSSKILKKRNAQEKVGVIAKVAGKTCVIEYSDMPENLLNATDNKGEMLYWAGSIAIHMLNVSFVDEITAGNIQIPFHRAVKKIQTVDTSGLPVEIEGIKYESFLFDALPLTDSSVTLEVRREDEFAPVKNPSGEDSLESSIKMQSALHRSWLINAGLKVPEATAVEISPLFALNPSDVKRQASKIHPLSGTQVFIE